MQYCFHDVRLEVCVELKGRHCGITDLLTDLHAAASRTPGSPVPDLRISVHAAGGSVMAPPHARRVLRAGGIEAYESRDSFYVTDGASLVTLDVPGTSGEALLAPCFFDREERWKRKFWTFVLLKLFRGLGIYSLHSAALCAPGEQGVLIVSGSGGGKSTLALGLIRMGWRFLSDDAVLLRQSGTGVEALALRAAFYINSGEESLYPEIRSGEEVHDEQGGRRRRIDVHLAYPGQFVPRCTPRLLLFSRIEPVGPSELQPISEDAALISLLNQSGPQLFDRRGTGRQLDLLVLLMQQAAMFKLTAGADLRADPSCLLQLLRRQEGLCREWLWS